MNGTTKESAVELLIVDNSRQKADSRASSLKNAGLAVHLKRIDHDEATLRDTLARQHFDMALFAAGQYSLPLDETLEIFEELAAELPLIILTSSEYTLSFAELIGTNVRDVLPAGDKDHLTLAVMREIGDLRIRQSYAEMKHSLVDAESRCESLIESSKAAIAYIHEGMHMQANSAYLKLFGFADMEDIEGLPILELVSAEDHAEFKKLLRSLSNQGDQPITAELNCQRDDGETFSASMEFFHATLDDEPCMQVIIRDRSVGGELEQRLQQLSCRDLHTDLYNRQYFFDQLEATVNQSLQTPGGGDIALLYIILDNFQEIRSTTGIAVSDSILKEVGQILGPVADEGDILARFGDHTFSLMTRNKGREELEALASRICSLISSHEFEQGSHFVAPTCSIGITMVSFEVSSAQDMINLAYHACDAARQAGGDQYIFSAQEELEDEETGSENDLAELLDYALKNDRFDLVFQPIISLQGDTRENYAVMVRLLDSNDEEILPNFFLNQAEQAGLMYAIDRWIIRHAIAELSKQRKAGRKVNFFIIISAASLEDEGLLLWICDCLREYEAKGPWVTFQVSDHVARHNLPAMRQLAEGLKKIKCPLAIDHFGMAPEPEKLLNSLPIDYIKLDPDFMLDLASNQEKQDVLNEVNKLAQSHDVKTIATGVEDASSLAILWTIGVNYIRGYFLQEPSRTFDYDFKQT